MSKKPIFGKKIKQISIGSVLVSMGVMSKKHFIIFFNLHPPPEDSTFAFFATWLGRGNSNLCIRCQRCMYSCSPKAIFFRDSLRYVDYNKCKVCLKCVEVCDHSAIEVISIEGGQLKGFTIDPEKSMLCKNCLKEDFCFKNLYKLQIDKNGNEKIVFQEDILSECYNCLKYFKNCPNNAIIPNID